MKIFATILLVAISAHINADVSSLNPNAYNYHSHQTINTPVPPPPPSHHQAPPPPFTPSQQYLPIQRFQPSSSISIGFSDVSLPVPVPPSSTPRRYRPRVKIPKKPTVTKNFFIHSAPEETEDDLKEELSQLSNPRKHYNVLFVKTPSQTSKAAAVNLANALKQEKTVVYVLSKKTTASDLQDAIAEAPQHISKPEVFFIKYRTPEEAAHAQRQIQSQYDSLGGGSSIISDEGVAPTTSVVGSLDPAEDDEEEIVDERQQLQQVEQQPPQQLQLQHHPQPQQKQTFDEHLVNSINNIAGGGSSDNNNQYLPPNRF